MKKAFIFILLIFICLTLSFSEEWIFSIVEIPVKNSSELLYLKQLGADIDNFKDGVVRAYIPQENIPLIENAGFLVNVVFEDSREVSKYSIPDPDMEKRNGRDISFDQYHDPDATIDALNDIHTNYPSITELYQVGSSVQGRELWAIKITDNPSVEELEPEYRLIGLHHGNEEISVEVALYLADYLTCNYDSDDFITSLVDEREIWIFPMINPDGWLLNRRYNYNWVDLNRNYSYMWDPDYENRCGPYPFSEPETQAVRNFSQNGYDYPNTFVYAITGHSGAECYNAPWNYSETGYSYYHPTPDDDLLMFIGYYYQQLNTTNGFWVTNGCDWYATWGDCNDWSYGERSCMDITLEYYYDYTHGYNPPPGGIVTVCEDNLYAILMTINLSGCGIWGEITDADTGQPIPAEIDVEGIDWTYYNDPAKGDYHRMLLPGTYDITVSSDGYVPRTVEGVEVEWYDNRYDYYDIYLPYNTKVSSTRIDFELDTVKSLAGNLPDRDSNDEDVEMKISPNPICESGSIIVNMSGEYNGMVELSIYDISGRKLKTVYDGSGSGGEFVYSMELGDYLTSGTYLAVLKTEDKVVSKKFVVMR